MEEGVSYVEGQLTIYCLNLVTIFQGQKSEGGTYKIRAQYPAPSFKLIEREG